MTIVTQSSFNNIAIAISAYADAARADSSLLLSTALVGSDARITDSGEGYTGTIRWLDYSDPASVKPESNFQGDTNSTNPIQVGQMLGIGNKSANYIKNFDVVGAQEASVQSLISKVDGLSYLGSKFGAVRARREENNLRSVLEGIGNNVLAQIPTLAASAVGVAFDTVGFHTSTNASSALEALFAQTSTSVAAPARSSFFDNLLDAMSKVSGEFEDAFYYLVIDAETFNVLRKENVLDTNLVQDGNLSINTLLGGKIRLILTGNAVSSATSTTANTVTASPQLDSVVTAGSQKVAYLVKAGALHYSNVAVNNPTAIDTNPLAHLGAGTVTVVNRWSNIVHPQGWSYTNNSVAVNSFPTNANLQTANNWAKTLTNVNETGIFPIFHG